MSTFGSKVFNQFKGPLSKPDRERLLAARKSVERLEADLSGLTWDSNDLNYLARIIRHGVLLALDEAGENIRPLATFGGHSSVN
ncbi:MAG: hypothetical protein JKY32_08180 [Rhizobiales bacterium]|nr:hypothetical protein [Hyphomicrobiales bacterium]